MASCDAAVLVAEIAHRDPQLQPMKLPRMVGSMVNPVRVPKTDAKIPSQPEWWSERHGMIDCLFLPNKSGTK